MKLLINQYPLVSQQKSDYYGYTGLIYSCENSYLEIVKLLLNFCPQIIE